VLPQYSEVGQVSDDSHFSPLETRAAHLPAKESQISPEAQSAALTDEQDSPAPRRLSHLRVKELQRVPSMHGAVDGLQDPPATILAVHRAPEQYSPVAHSVLPLQVAPTVLRGLMHTSSEGSQYDVGWHAEEMLHTCPSASGVWQKLLTHARPALQGRATLHESPAAPVDSGTVQVRLAWPRSHQSVA
jgi:hypothetical protein